MISINLANFTLIESTTLAIKDTYLNSSKEFFGLFDSENEEVSIPGLKNLNTRNIKEVKETEFPNVYINSNGTKLYEKIYEIYLENNYVIKIYEYQSGYSPDNQEEYYLKIGNFDIHLICCSIRFAINRY